MRAVLLLLLAASACGSLPARWPLPECGAGAQQIATGNSPPQGSHTPRVILIALDGVRWQEVFLGVDEALARSAGMSPEDIVPARQLLPAIWSRVIDRGVAIGAPGGPQVLASGPEFVSLPGYQELLGGHPATTCGGNGCPPIARATLLDQARARFGASQVAAIASWEPVERATSIDNAGFALSVGRHGGAGRARLRVDACTAALLDTGAAVPSSPGWHDYRPDRYTAALALAYLAAVRPRVLFVALGDTDEYGHEGDYGAYLESLRAIDRFVGALFAQLDGMGDDGAATTVLLTADHGWSWDFTSHGSAVPESARSWLLAAGGDVPRRGVIKARAPHVLADVAPTVRALLGLAPDTTPGAGTRIPELLP